MEIISEGQGELLGWRDPEEHRKWVLENKSSEMFDKSMSMSDAVSKFLNSGDYIASGGFGQVRVSMAAMQEIVRQGVDDLIVGGKTATHDLDFLIAAGCVDKVEVAYSFGHELRGLSPASRRAVEGGEVEVATEWSNAGLQWRFKAAASGVPFIPGYIMAGTDTFKYSSAKIVEDPFTERPICLIPACYPDVAFIHVHKCDKYGNAQISDSLVEDFELSRAAKRLIITTEEIVSNEEIRDEPWKTDIPYFYTDAVVEVPYGCHPCNMPNRYYSDEEHMAEYLSLTKTAEGADEYIEKYVLGVEDFEEYLDLVGGVKKLKYLERLEEGRDEYVYPWANSGG